MPSPFGPLIGAAFLGFRMKPSFHSLLKYDVQLKELAIIFALAVLFAILVRLAGGNLLPPDLQHLIFR